MKLEESGRTLKFSFSNAKASFYRAFNAMYGKIGRLASEDIILQLLRAKCMPVLLYATEVCQMLSRDKQSLEFTLTRLFMKIFRTASPTVVIECQRNFCFLPVALQIQMRTARFFASFCNREQFVFYFTMLLNNYVICFVNIMSIPNKFANAVYGKFTVVDQ